MKPAFRSRHRAFALLLSAAAILATWTGVGQTLEVRGYRLAAVFAPDTAPAHRVAVITLTPARAPELRLRAAESVRRLHALGAGPVAVLLPLDRSANPPGLRALERAADPLRASSRRHTTALTEAVDRLDVDGRLADAMAASRRTLIAAFVQPGTPPTSDSKALAHDALPAANTRDRFLHRAAAVLLDPADPPAHVIPPLAALRSAAAGVGIVPGWRDGAAVAAVPLWVGDGDLRLPGIALALAAATWHRTPDRISPHPGSVRIGGHTVTVGPDGRFYPLPLARAQARKRVAVYSATDLLRGKVSARALRGRPVLVGVDRGPGAPGLVGPAGGQWTPLTWTAQSVAAILGGKGARIPPWFYGAQRGAVLVVALWLVLLPWGLRGRLGLVLGTLVALALLNAGLVAMLTRSLWLPVVAPALFLMAGQLLLMLNHRGEAALLDARQETVSARRQLGLNLQNQGQLDAALEQFQACADDPDMDEPLYQLALEYERRRQFPKALAVYQGLEEAEPGFRDVADRRAHLETLTAHLPAGNALGNAGTSTVALDNPAVEKPVLGRYRIERLLGQGAMGAVYLAEDPDIGRTVALKALPLAEEFEGAALEEARGRLRREAEAAGRLKHPNIVAVYDVGEEHDLAYIAMDYAEGRSLAAWTEGENLLPVDEVLYVCAEVAEALHYAHARKVVHRDIKPGNVIYDPDSGVVKVTDFGVASLVDDRKTRTGTVLGSPSYMSPEQITGNRIDGRSDLFSLGVTLYQLLTARLPFRGDSVANLAYRITQEKHPNLGRVRRGLPACASRIVNKALQKDPGDRYASGIDMAEALRRCGGARAARKRK
ncbi:MAG TPA: protein kinase [Gammaproteobacteria bacterium]|nr:protein kinase [Gammaproteobacteria bacterium]